MEVWGLSVMRPNYLGEIERGERNPSFLNIARLARALNVPLRDVFADGDWLSTRSA